MRHGVVETHLGHDSGRRDAALLQQVDVLVPGLERCGRNAQQHGVVDLTGRGHGQTLHIGARLALLAVLGDLRAPLVVRAGGALLGLRGLGVRSGRGAVVAVAVGLLDRAFAEPLAVVGLGDAGVRLQHDHFDAGCGLAVAVRLGHEGLLVAALDVEDLALDRDDREAALLAGGEVVERDAECLGDGGGELGAVERDEVAHGVYSV